MAASIPTRCWRRCRTAAKRLIHGDMAQLAEATGSVISAVLFGALAGSKALPIQRTAFEAAIHRGGVGVKQSLAAFAAGFAAANRRPPAKPAAPPSAAPVSPALAPLMAEAERLSRAGPHHDPRRYRAARRLPGRGLCAALSRPAEIHRRSRARHGDGSGRLLAETARELALGMAYEDTVRVAELKIRPSRFERVRAGGAARRRPDPGDRRILSSARAGDRRHAAAEPGPLAARQRLAAPRARALHAQGQGAQDIDRPRLPRALHGRGAQGRRAPARCAMPTNRHSSTAG